MIKAIETSYKGYRFRSRIEARWAVFFDTLGISWRYEPEGYKLSDGTWYLPDFYLPSYETWIEVKGNEPTDEERRKAYLLSAGLKQPVLIHQGSIPELECSSDEYYLRYEDGCNITLYAGHAWDMWQKPVMGNVLYFHHDEIFGPELLPNLMRGKFPDRDVPKDGSTELNRKRLVRLDQEYCYETRGVNHPKWEFGRIMSYLAWDKDGLRNKYLWQGISEAAAEAYDKARQARFEHGEKGYR